MTNDSDDGEGTLPLTRRDLLAAGTLGGLGLFASDPAAAQAGGGDATVGIEDDGEFVMDAGTINFDAGLSATDTDSATVDVSATGGTEGPSVDTVAAVVGKNDDDEVVGKILHSGETFTGDVLVVLDGVMAALAPENDGPGGTVMLKNGTYLTMGEEVAHLRSGVNLVAESKHGAKIKLDPETEYVRIGGTPDPGTQMIGSPEDGGADHVHVWGLRMDGSGEELDWPRANVTSAASAVDDTAVWVQVDDAAAIEPYAGVETSIALTNPADTDQDWWRDDPAHFEIELSKDQVDVVGNRIKLELPRDVSPANDDYFVVEPWVGGVENDHAEFISIEGCLFENMFNASAVRIGRDLDEGMPSADPGPKVLRDNWVTNHNGGIAVSGPESVNVLIENNWVIDGEPTLHKFFYDPLSIEGGHHSSVVDNFVFGYTDRAVRAPRLDYGCVIANNVLANPLPIFHDFIQEDEFYDVTFRNVHTAPSGAGEDTYEQYPNAWVVSNDYTNVGLEGTDGRATRIVTNGNGPAEMEFDVSSDDADTADWREYNRSHIWAYSRDESRVPLQVEVYDENGEWERFETKIRAKAGTGDARESPPWEDWERIGWDYTAPVASSTEDGIDWWHVDKVVLRVVDEAPDHLYYFKFWQNGPYTAFPITVYESTQCTVADNAIYGAGVRDGAITTYKGRDLTITGNTITDSLNGIGAGGGSADSKRNHVADNVLGSIVGRPEGQHGPESDPNRGGAIDLPSGTANDNLLLWCNTGIKAERAHDNYVFKSGESRPTEAGGSFDGNKFEKPPEKVMTNPDGVDDVRLSNNRLVGVGWGTAVDPEDAGGWKFRGNHVEDWECPIAFSSTGDNLLVKDNAFRGVPDPLSGLAGHADSIAQDNDGAALYEGTVSVGAGPGNGNGSTTVIEGVHGDASQHPSIRSLQPQDPPAGFALDTQFRWDGEQWNLELSRDGRANGAVDVKVIVDL